MTYQPPVSDATDRADAAVPRADPLRTGAVAVVERLRAAGHEAYWAGGCVRDQLLGLRPKDYDVTTDADPQRIIDLFERSIPVGVQFGVVRVLLGRLEFEIATFRADLGYSDGRRPDAVAWTDAREDVLRRDFTINGLLYDPVDHRIADFVEGVDDLRRGVVRAIGAPEARFAEDRLRLIRAIRFAARFGFQVEPETWRALLLHAPEIGAVSPERIHAELERILTEGGAARGLRLLTRSALLPRVLRELADPERAALRFDGAGPLSPQVAWTTVLYDLEGWPESIEALGRRLRWSTALVRHVTHALDMAHALARYAALGVPGRKRLLRRPELPTALAAARLVARAGQSDGHGLGAAARDLAVWSRRALAPPRLLGGQDLKQAGFAPGPFFAEALSALEDAQLEGRVTTREQAWALVEQLRR